MPEAAIDYEAQIERDVAQREILFERRRMANPLTETLREDQARVADRQRITPEHGCAHRFLTSSGMS